eukprot:5667550-Prymnesium_polylepis.1
MSDRPAAGVAPRPAPANEPELARPPSRVAQAPSSASCNEQLPQVLLSALSTACCSPSEAEAAQPSNSLLPSSHDAGFM